MKRKLLVIIILFQIPFLMTGQNDNNFEVQADAASNTELQVFQKKFNVWIQSIKNDTLKTVYKPERMINNFILFSEDGLMMKDLKFHSPESCKTEIIASLPNQENKADEMDWIYVTLESQVNKPELIEILTFFQEKNIEYRFGQEDEFIPQMIKK
ncbi:hypothetical protein [Cellulophaga sp. HaHa_2_1]|jgi:hypothetical protein|uniref:hypothetical protein n=1 Tax=Cellulophaga sp. HaHa_2_1 TaxID=2749994 RepID=UPI001C4F38C7|nr:hypothetical protein [Cellulophaga sp. HaHa_2_1]QXP52619.1 hypothetical protein H0I24_01465 [Cellulophaga sp. HaHa_2_1]